MEIQSKTRQTGSRRMVDLKGGGTVQLTLMMHQNKYQINPMYTSHKIFDEIFTVQYTYSGKI